MEQKIIKLLQENPNGLILVEIAKKLKSTTYHIRSWVFSLRAKNKVEMIDVGQAKLVRLTSHSNSSRASPLKKQKTTEDKK